MNDILKKEAVIRVQKAINDFDKNLQIQILNETARTASDAAKALNCNRWCNCKESSSKNRS